MTKLYPGSINYIASISLKAITREENKIKIVKETPLENSKVIEKKYRNEEKERKETSIQTKEAKIDNIQQQMQKLEITVKQQQEQVIVKQEEIILLSGK